MILRAEVVSLHPRKSPGGRAAPIDLVVEERDVVWWVMDENAMRIIVETTVFEASFASNRPFARTRA